MFGHTPLEEHLKASPSSKVVIVFYPAKKTLVTSYPTSMGYSTNGIEPSWYTNQTIIGSLQMGNLSHTIRRAFVEYPMLVGKSIWSHPPSSTTSIECYPIETTLCYLVYKQVGIVKIWLWDENSSQVWTNTTISFATLKSRRQYTPNVGS